MGLFCAACRSARGSWTRAESQLQRTLLTSVYCLAYHVCRTRADWREPESAESFRGDVDDDDDEVIFSLFFRQRVVNV
jgi:hypothetical protein